MSDVPNIELATDEWVGNRDKGTTVAAPCWAAIITAFDALDQQVRTQLLLRRGARSLVVGGGNGNYNVYVSSDDDDTLLTLSDPARAGETPVRLVAGGQFGDYPAHIIVGRDAALLALKTFFADGTTNTSLVWDPSA